MFEEPIDLSKRGSLERSINETITNYIRSHGGKVTTSNSSNIAARVVQTIKVWNKSKRSDLQDNEPQQQ